MVLSILESLLFLLLNFLHQLIDFLLETLLEFLFHFRVFLYLRRRCSDYSLKLGSGSFRLASDALVLCKIFLEVIENLKFLI